MTAADRSPLVRPQFLRWSTVVFVLLVPFVVHAIWDYVEIRRLERAVSEIRKRREPMLTSEIRPAVTPTGDPAEAARYYRAAAALAPNATLFDRSTGSVIRLPDVERESWTADVVAEVRRHVARGDESLRLLDRATALSVYGFGAGMDYSYESNDMMALARLAAWRTRVRAIDADGDGAAASLNAELRLQQALDGTPAASPIPGFVALNLRDAIVAIVSRSQPGAAALAQIAARLREMDQDDRLTRRWLLARAAIFDGARFEDVPLLSAGRVRLAGVGVTILRPWLMMQLNDRVEQLAILIDGASRPWPARMDPLPAYLSNSAAARRFRLIDEWQTARFATDVVLIRCARVVVAIERYRLDHDGAMPSHTEDLVPAFLDASPIDPFSGRPLRLLAQDAGYIVYSFGPNRRDDRGQLATRAMVAGRLPGAPPTATDLGIQISHR